MHAGYASQVWLRQLGEAALEAGQKLAQGFTRLYKLATSMAR